MSPRRASKVESAARRPVEDGEPWIYEALIILMALAFCYFVGAAFLAGMRWIMSDGFAW